MKRKPRAEASLYRQYKNTKDVMRSITIDYEDIHITLHAPSMAEARVRRALNAILEKRDDKPQERGVWSYYITALTEIEGLRDTKITVCPPDAQVNKLFDDWIENTDEALGRKIEDAIVQLANISVPPKASGESSAST